MSLATSPRRLAKITFATASGCFIALYVLVSVCVGLYQDQLVFPAPSGFPNLTPASLGLAFEDLYISVDGSEQIHAWYIPSSGASQKVILYFHGNAYTIEDAVSEELRDLHETGANLLAVDYRGYGKSSPGQASGTRVCEDARAAMRYLTEQRHVRVEDVLIVGRSIGTGVAAQLASEHPHAAGLVLLSPFTTLHAVARQNHTMRLLPLELMGSRNKFDTLSKMPSLHMPLLLVVGDQDRLTPPWMAQKLFERANQPKQIYIVSRADHNDLWEFGGRRLIDKLSALTNAAK